MLIGRPERSSYRPFPEEIYSNFNTLSLNHLDDKYPRNETAAMSDETVLNQLILQLDSSQVELQANAARYLQHLVYKNPKIKELLWTQGGIGVLVQLIYSEYHQIYTPVLETLRNISTGGNPMIKEEIARSDGIRALAWHIKTRQIYNNSNSNTILVNYDRSVNSIVGPSLEAASSVLLQLAITNQELKERVLHEALLPTLVTYVLQPFATQAIIECSESLLGPPSFNLPLFCHIASIVR
ncbi:Plakophilin-4 [Cichlidogyrus casuarinus]|uniref:Plakophilin-4 n=1 Tax=Cichlidogyrus casuarinus TaxID=1844966 RepID=A0ABD2PXG7_9PLAT